MHFQVIEHLLPLVQLQEQDLETFEPISIDQEGELLLDEVFFEELL